MLIDGAEVGRLPMFGTISVELPPGEALQAGWRFARSANVEHEEIDPHRPLVFTMTFGRERGWRARLRMVGLPVLYLVFFAAMFTVLPAPITDTDAFIWAATVSLLAVLAFDTVRPGGSAVLTQ